ncbi:MAG: hypothetical protein HUJ71_02995 [Pseudobutyrivibrio sp.]|nr:hypothetical protein [Pseudobutyrivibrio sp.]
MLDIKGQKLYIGGVDDPDGSKYSDNTPTAQQLKQISEAVPKDAYSILLSHRPELFLEYQNLNFDLVLSGHAHGGQCQIPGICKGLYAPD